MNRKRYLDSNHRLRISVKRGQLLTLFDGLPHVLRQQRLVAFELLDLLPRVFLEKSRVRIPVAVPINKLNVREGIGERGQQKEG